jgi:hypothetical protein
MVSVAVVMIETIRKGTDQEDKDLSNRGEADQDHQRKPFRHAVALARAHHVPSDRHTVALKEPAVILNRLKPVCREADKLAN